MINSINQALEQLIAASVGIQPIAEYMLTLLGVIMVFSGLVCALSELFGQGAWFKEEQKLKNEEEWALIQAQWDECLEAAEERQYSEG